MSSLPLALLLQASAGGGGMSTTGFLIQIVLFIAIFYFIIMRPQQKQKQQHEESLRNLRRGDRVVTTGGIIGEVVHVKETLVDGAATRSMEDEVTIRSGESRLIVERGRIARIISAQTTTSA